MISDHGDGIVQKGSAVELTNSSAIFANLDRKPLSFCRNQCHR